MKVKHEWARDDTLEDLRRKNLGSSRNNGRLFFTETPAALTAVALSLQ